MTTLWVKSKESLKWTFLDGPTISDATKHLLDSITFQIFPIPKRTQHLEVILITSKAKLHSFAHLSTPLIVMPHGGPHSNLTTAFSLAVTSFVSLGFGVLLVNYTGSTGFNQDSIDALIGNIGDLEVQDIHSAAVWASQLPELDATNVFLHGGSHAGFTNAHLLAMHPEFYKGGVIRNPVINVGSMPYNSDIPDVSNMIRY